MRPGDLVTCYQGTNCGVLIYETRWESAVVGSLHQGELAMVIESVRQPVVGDLEGEQIRVIIAKSCKTGWNYAACFKHLNT